MANDVFEMSDAEHMAWLREQGATVLDVSQPSEENLCHLVSHALRTLDKADRAQSFVDIANMALALSDKALGADTVYPRCLVLQKH